MTEVKTTQLAKIVGASISEVHRLYRLGVAVCHGRPGAGQISKTWTLGDGVRLKVILFLTRSGLSEIEAGALVNDSITDELIDQVVGHAHVVVRWIEGRPSMAIGEVGDLGAEGVSVICLQNIIDKIRKLY